MGKFELEQSIVDIFKDTDTKTEAKAVKSLLSTGKAQKGTDLKKTAEKKAEQKETRTRRVQLVLAPSLYAKLKTAAHKQETSINDYIHSLLEENIKEK